MALSMPTFAYVAAGSNYGWYYPPFNEYLPYNPSYDEVQSYLNDARQYVSNCNEDMQQIEEARNNAVQQANNVVSSYNLSH
jgi:hypothetical protein